MTGLINSLNYPKTMFEQFQSENGPYGSFEIFQSVENWYWWHRSPGCLPDSDPFGPFESEDEAREDALNP